MTGSSQEQDHPQDQLPQLRRELTEARSGLFSFVEACAVVNSTLDETRLLYTIVDMAVMLTGSEHGELYLRDPGQPVLLYREAAYGSRRRGLLHQLVDQEQGAAGFVTTQGECLLVEDASADERFRHLQAGASGPVRWLVSVPVPGPDGEIMGALEVYNRTEGPYRTKDLQFLDALANQAGACITSTRLFDQVQEDQRWISSIVDGMSDGVIVADPRGNVALANEAARNLFGLDEDLEPPAGDLHLPLLMAEIEEMEHGESFDYVLLKPHTEILSVRTTKLRDEDGELRASILAMRNVRELKEVERKNLEFLSLVSHELESHFEGLEAGLPDELEGKAGEVADLVANLVFYSEIESGPMRIERRHMDLHVVVHQAVEELRRQFEGQQMALELVSGDPLEVQADPERIGVVVRGILRHVLVSASSGCHIRVALTPPGPGEAVVRITFQVEGLALNEQEIEELFDKSYQVENFISILGRQTTGLAFVFLRHIAQAHGGDVQAVPTPGGVRFEVTMRVQG